jgi:hypothetical protein
LAKIGLVSANETAVPAGITIFDFAVLLLACARPCKSGGRDGVCVADDKTVSNSANASLLIVATSDHRLAVLYDRRQPIDSGFIVVQQNISRMMRGGVNDIL